MIPTRSALLAIFLAAAVVFMAVKTYFVWNEGPWDLPNPPTVSSPAAGAPRVVPQLPRRERLPVPPTS